jgi:hypothetical protein
LKLSDIAILCPTAENGLLSSVVVFLKIDVPGFTLGYAFVKGDRNVQAIT